MRSVVVVRHGQSHWNVEDRYQGQADSGLTDVGRDQADAVADWLAEHLPRPAAVFSSDLPRVADTAVPYLARLGLTATYDARLREIDVGTWAGKTFAEIQATDPDTARRSGAGEDLRRGGGETFAELRERVVDAVGDAVAGLGPKETVVIFSHGGPIRVLAAWAAGAPSPGHQHLSPPGNCSITTIAVAPQARALAHYNQMSAVNSAPTRVE